MARPKKTVSNESKPKSTSLFDVLNFLTADKRSWDSLTESDRKQVSPYMLNRFISMNRDLLPIVNEFQHYTIGLLNAREVYKLYLDILPKSKMFFRYVKGQSEDKYNSELIKYVSLHLKCSNAESIEYLDVLKNNKDYSNLIFAFLKQYGLEDKVIKKII